MSALADLTVSDLIAFWSANETWRLIEGFPYEVSSFGNIRRLGKSVNLKPAFTHGYPHVTLCVDNQKTSARVHVHVAKAFLGPAPFGTTLVAHNDGEPSNCRVDNIRWASVLENRKDMVRHETQVHGSKSNFAKLHERDIPTIRGLLKQGLPRKAIAAQFNVSPDLIWQIGKNKIWKRASGAAWSINK